MKKTLIIKGITFSVFLTVLFILAGPGKGMAQDKKSKKPQKATVVIKINKEDGKTKIIDTTFVLSDPADHEKFEKYMKQYEGDLKSIEDNLKNMEVTVNIPDLDDSLKLDSLTKQITVISKGMDHPHFKFHERPEAFSYSYDFDTPAMPEAPGHFREFDPEDFMPEHDMKVMRFNQKGQSLNEILGEIPMDHVKSYSIKEKKNGKRITIDVSDYPFFEHHDKVIIMRAPGATPRPDGRKKIIIEREHGDKQDHERDED